MFPYKGGLGPHFPPQLADDAFHNSHSYKLRPRRPTAHHNPFKLGKNRPKAHIGSDEHTVQKVMDISSRIKRSLHEPTTSRIVTVIKTVDPPTPSSIENESNSKKSKKILKTKVPSSESCGEDENVQTAEEIYNKILEHITNMSQRRRLSFITSSSTKYDQIVDFVQKQKRLELSSAQRALNSYIATKQLPTTDILADIGIKLEDLPLKVIKEISHLFPDDLEFQQVDDSSSDTMIKIEEQDYSEFEENILKQPLISPVLNDFSEESPDLNKSNSSFETVEYLLNNPTIKMEVLDDPNNEEEESNEAIEYMNTSCFDQDFSSERCTTDLINDIDMEIARLIQMKNDLLNSSNSNCKNTNSTNQLDPEPVNDTSDDIDVSDDSPNNLPKQKPSLNNDCELSDVLEKIVVFKCIPDYVVAASESGILFFIDPKTCRIVHKVRITKLPIISISYYFGDLYIGSVNNHIIVYQTKLQRFLKPIKIYGKASCMEFKWDYLFVGTCSGVLLRYNLKNRELEFDEQIVPDRLSFIVANQEGARRVLLTSMHQEALISIRDAISGLLMRTIRISNEKMHSFILHENLIYCATNENHILVHSFYDGNLLKKYRKKFAAVKSCCMRISGNFLFLTSKCRIYVYNILEDRYVGFVNGPEEGIVSMTVQNRNIFIGSRSFQLSSLRIPDEMLQ